MKRQHKYEVGDILRYYSTTRKVHLLIEDAGDSVHDTYCYRILETDVTQTCHFDTLDLHISIQKVA